MPGAGGECVNSTTTAFPLGGGALLVWHVYRRNAAVFDNTHLPSPLSLPYSFSLSLPLSLAGTGSPTASTTGPGGGEGLNGRYTT